MAEIEELDLLGLRFYTVAARHCGGLETQQRLGACGRVVEDERCREQLAPGDVNSLGNCL